MTTDKLDLNALNPANPIAQHASIERRPELAQAMDLLLGAAHVEVCCMQRDLAVLDLSSISVVEKLEQLLTTRRGAHVRLLVDDPHWIDTQAPRLRALHRLTTHAFEIRQASESDPIGDDCAVIIDRHHLLDLKVGHLVHGELWLNQPHHAQPWQSTFDRRWEHAGHNLPATPLGL